MDTQFQPVGSSTNIHYQNDFEFYLKYLLKGLETGDRHVKEIFKIWNGEFYPNAENPLTRATILSGEQENNEALDELGRESEAEETQLWNGHLEVSVFCIRFLSHFR